MRTELMKILAVAGHTDLYSTHTQVLCSSLAMTLLSWSSCVHLIIYLTECMVGPGRCSAAAVVEGGDNIRPQLVPRRGQASGRA